MVWKSTGLATIHYPHKMPDNAANDKSLNHRKNHNHCGYLRLVLGGHHSAPSLPLMERSELAGELVCPTLKARQQDQGVWFDFICNAMSINYFTYFGHWQQRIQWVHRYGVNGSLTGTTVFLRCGCFEACLGFFAFFLERSLLESSGVLRFFGCIFCFRDLDPFEDLFFKVLFLTAAASAFFFAFFAALSSFSFLRASSLAIASKRLGSTDSVLSRVQQTLQVGFLEIPNSSPSLNRTVNSFGRMAITLPSCHPAFLHFMSQTKIASPTFAVLWQH